MSGSASLAPNGGIPVGLRMGLDACDDATGHAAGILFVAPDGDVLLLHRAGTEENFAHHWGLPGGGVEADETAASGAAREAREEAGFDADPSAFKPLDRCKTPSGLAFHTFAMPVKEKFVPKLNEEHSGYAWAPLNALPAPLHPALEKTLQERVGIDTQGFLKWIEDRDDVDTIDVEATDSALALALDKDTVRDKDRDGRLKVKIANISKANVCPYRGKEIPGWEKLGLDPDRIYNLFRDPEELKKGAESSNGVPLLRKHIKVSADDHQPYEVVGSLGTDGDFDGTYLTNSLFVNARDAIDDIESKKKRELSMGYHYTPDMTPGKFGDKAFDGVMRNIVVNHVALVEDGRAGPDVVVGDSMENLEMKTTRLAITSLGIMAAAARPLIAMDTSLPVDLFSSLNTKNFADSKSTVLDGIRKALDGKLKAGLAMDASIESLAKLLDVVGEGAGVDEEAPAEAVNKMEEIAKVEPVAPTPTTYDAEPLKKFLAEKGMGEDDIGTVMGMLPNSQAQDEDEEEKKDNESEGENLANREKREKAEDSVSKTAMDAALKAQREDIIKTERGIRVALAEVKPWVGELPVNLAFDSAAGVYRHTLKALGHAKHASLHEDALLDVLKSYPRPGDRAPTTKTVPLAMDESAISKAAKFAPGLDRIKTLA